MPFDSLGPDVVGQLAAMGQAGRRVFARGQVVAVSGNDADIRVGYDARGEALLLRQVPICSGYAPRVGDWVAISYEAGHSGAPWVTGPSMAADATADSAGVGVFSVSASAPAEPATSTVYFDTAAGTWRGWNGSAWVDFGSELHNHLGGLQGGAASEYYHLGQAEHDALQDFYDGSAMASGYLKRLRFKAIDASGTQRTNLFEKDGDFYWAINAAYDAGTDTWNRIDTGEYAYLIGLYSEHGIPHEPGELGGIAWWRVTPGTNPIGDYTAVGGWELGWMMTEHRNFVMGGMNAELDGSGSPPYGRFSQAGHEDPDNFTALLRNAWYEGNAGGEGDGSWGVDEAGHPCWFAGFVDSDGFVLKYRAAAAGPFHTTDWVKALHVTGDGDLWVKRHLDVDGTATLGHLSGFVRAAAGLLSASTLVDADIPASIARDSEVAAYFDTSTGHDHDGTDARKVEWTSINSKPATFPPSSHTHAQNDITDLQTDDVVTFAGVTLVDLALTKGSSSGLRAANGYGYIEIGPSNTSWCHLRTDRASFWFSTKISVSGGIFEAYSGSDFQAAAGGSVRLTLSRNDGLATFAGAVQVEGATLTLGNRNAKDYRCIVTESGVNAEDSAVLTSSAARGRCLALFGNGAAYFLGRDVTNDVEFGMGCSSAVVAYAGAMTNHGFELRTSNLARITVDASGNIGFFGVTPVARQSVASFGSTSGTANDGLAREKCNQIIAALQSLGLFS